MTGNDIANYYAARIGAALVAAGLTGAAMAWVITFLVEHLHIVISWTH
jgi:hypothetical protein